MQFHVAVVVLIWVLIAAQVYSLYIESKYDTHLTKAELDEWLHAGNSIERVVIVVCVLIVVFAACATFQWVME